MSVKITKKHNYYHLETSNEINQPIEKVFEFFSKAENLEFLTPKILNFKITSKLPIEMKEGATIDYKLRIHGIPIKWKSEIKEWKPPYKFIDNQIKGPYLLWEHTHTFEDLKGKTLVKDSVHYRVFGGAIINYLFVERDLYKIFNYREEKLKKVFNN